MSINLYFSSHYQGALTTPLLKQLFAEADVVLIEQAFQDDADVTLNMLNELSRGNLLIEDVQNVMSGIGGPPHHPEFDHEIKSLIFRSGKRILVEKPPAKMISGGRPSMLQNVAAPPGRATLRVLETTFKEIDKVFDDNASVIESEISQDWDHTCQPLMKHYGGAYVEYDLDLDSLRTFATKLDEQLKSMRPQLG